MFTLAILIGVYSYAIFAIGVLGFIYKPLLLLFTFFYIACATFFFRREIYNIFQSLKKINFSLIKKKRLESALLFLLILEIIVNFIGVLGPEISYDALWYHLTLPKLYILNHSIFHIPGNLLYYSDTPKLTEMLYTISLLIYNEIFAKFIHFLFGLLIIISIYQFSKKYIPTKYSLLAALIFYSSLVVGWESISAYVDLARTFFEFLSFWAFIVWFKNKDKRFLFICGLMLGLATTVKLVAVGSVLIIFVILLYFSIIQKNKIMQIFKNSLILLIPAIIVPLPWLIFSYINTNNPFYPFFSLSIAPGFFLSVPNLNNLLSDIYITFLGLNDPISPVYLISIPVIILFFRKSGRNFKAMGVYVLLAFLVWYFTQKWAGGRFILPYLPVFSILIAVSVYRLKNILLRNFFIAAVLLIAISSIGYRSVANSKFVPVILGVESKEVFLTKYLNFNYGDFYDTDGYFKNHIGEKDKVLLYGFHNLYYVNFPYIDSSWVKRGDTFNFIAVQNALLPQRFHNFKQVYYNRVTNVKLYTLSRRIWTY